MLDEIHKGLQSLDEAVTDLQKMLFDLPRLETELVTLLKLASEPDSRFQAVRMVSLPSTMDFNVVVSIEDLVEAKRQELTDRMISLQKAALNADKAFTRLNEFDPNHVPDVAPEPIPPAQRTTLDTSVFKVSGTMWNADGTARDNANEVA